MNESASNFEDIDGRQKPSGADEQQHRSPYWASVIEFLLCKEGAEIVGIIRSGDPPGFSLCINRCQARIGSKLVPEESQSSSSRAAKSRGVKRFLINPLCPKRPIDVNP